MNFAYMPLVPRRVSGICLIAIAALLLCGSCFGSDIKITSYAYDKAYAYGQDFNISATVENNGFGAAWAYLSPVLIHTETGVEKYPAASIVKRRLFGGESYTFTTQGWRQHEEFCPLPAGEYRVVLIVYTDNDKEACRLYADEPIFVNFTRHAKIDTDTENENS